MSFPGREKWEGFPSYMILNKISFNLKKKEIEKTMYHLLF